MASKWPIVDNLGGDLELAKQLANEFIAYSAEQRPILWAALARKDAEELRHRAHQLKGAAGYFSDDEITLLLQQMEDAGRRSRFDVAEKLLGQVDVKLKKIVSELNELIG